MGADETGPGVYRGGDEILKPDLGASSLLVGQGEYFVDDLENPTIEGYKDKLIAEGRLNPDGTVPVISPPIINS